MTTFRWLTESFKTYQITYQAYVVRTLTSTIPHQEEHAKSSQVYRTYLSDSNTTTGQQTVRFQCFTYVSRVRHNCIAIQMFHKMHLCTKFDDVIQSHSSLFFKKLLPPVKLITCQSDQYTFCS